MTKRTNAIITTACLGMAAGAAAFMISGSGNSRTRKLRKSTGKALRQVGDFIDNVSYMMK